MQIEGKKKKHWVVWDLLSLEIFDDRLLVLFKQKCKTHSLSFTWIHFSLSTLLSFNWVL